MPNHEEAKAALELALVLPFLPAAKMEEGFLYLMNRMLLAYLPNVQKMHRYFHRMWLPLAENVSVFGQEVRTNNIAENFHRHLNAKIGSRKPLWIMSGKNMYFYSILSLSFIYIIVLHKNYRKIVVSRFFFYPCNCQK